MWTIEYQDIKLKMANRLKACFPYIVLLLVVSIFIASISNIIRLDDDSQATASFSSGLAGQNLGIESNDSKSEKPVSLGDNPESIIWFLQISDLHISIFQDPSRVSELREFCELTVSAIHPAVVLASGDLTDAKTSDSMGSRQYSGEWKLYKDVLDKCNIKNKTEWLDIRGNHDNFDVPSAISHGNYFRNYSIQGRNHPKSYLYQTARGGETYSFIAVDACLDPGPRRPFNFVGAITEEEAERLKTFANKSRMDGDHAIWFGHYPTSCILSPSNGDIRTIIADHPDSLVYVCGHLHMLGGIVPNMYTRHQLGFLELELGDWKVNRVYRLMAIDNGLLSFVDVYHRAWPVALVTNPKHALYTMPTREPLHKIRDSTHVRILAFSLDPIVEVKVRIDKGVWRYCVHIDGPVYVSEWNPDNYAVGLHEIHVIVKDQMGRQSKLSQPFSLDGSRLSFGVLSRLILMCNLTAWFQICYVLMVVVCVAPLAYLRYIRYKSIRAASRSPGHSPPAHPPRCAQRGWLRRLWLISVIDRMFYPMVVHPIFLAFGPWFVGEVIHKHTGVIFAWGTFINGQFLPGSFTYLYGFIHMVLFQVPLIAVVGLCLEIRLRNYLAHKKEEMGPATHCYIGGPFCVLIAIQLVQAYFFWMAYGTMAFLLGPLRTWSAILACVLWYHIANLPSHVLREASVALLRDRRLN